MPEERFQFDFTKHCRLSLGIQVFLCSNIRPKPVLNSGVYFLAVVTTGQAGSLLEPTMTS